MNVPEKLTVEPQSGRLEIVSATGNPLYLVAPVSAEGGATVDEFARLAAAAPALRAALRYIAEYTGEGPHTTPWQEIVRDLSGHARDALRAAGGAS